VEDLADTRLAEKISQLTGVGLVTIVGGQKPAVRVQANPTQLSAYGLNMEDLRAALEATSINQAKGNFDGKELSYQINANDQLSTSADYNQGGGRLSKWRARHAVRRGQGDRRSGEHQASRLDEPNPRHHRQHPAPAGR